jgi:hypothetical protein
MPYFASTLKSGRFSNFKVPRLGLLLALQRLYVAEDYSSAELQRKCNPAGALLANCLATYSHSTCHWYGYSSLYEYFCLNQSND